MTTIVKAHVSGQHTPIMCNDGPKIFYFSDGFDPDVVHQMQQQLGRPDAVICDVEGTVEDIGYPVYFVPACDMGLLVWINNVKHTELTVIDKTKYCFCWSVNRKHIDRYLVIRLIEFFGFESFRYTWSAVDQTMDCAPLIAEMQELSEPWLTPELRSHILGPAQTARRFIVPPDVPFKESNTLLEPGGIQFVNDVQHQLSRECAVYLLTESMTGTHQHYTFTEKTLWCLMNGCFPIWAGNYAQAEMAERMGLDVFSDVIDHSYQYKKTLLERCWHALHDNVKILSDLGFARELRDRHRDRLYSNMQWVREHKIKKFLDMQRNELAGIGVELDPENFRFKELL